MVDRHETARKAALDVLQQASPSGFPLSSDGLSDVELVERLTALSAAALADPEGSAIRRRICHDIRGSLAVIAGQCEMLDAGVWGALTDPQQVAVGKVLKHVDLVGKHVDRISGRR